MANEAFPLDTNGAGWIAGGAAPGTTSSTTIGQGSVAQGGSEQYWLPIWSGEILNAYDQYNVFEPLVSSRVITSGTTMRFPITGTVGHKAQWKAGEELVGSSTINEPKWFDISLDSRPMASYFELDDISLMLTQWEYRSELARQAGLALANARDKQIASMIIQGSYMASRSPAVSKGGNFEGTNPGAGTLSTANYDDASTYDMEANVLFNCLGNTTATQANRTKAALLLLEYIERYMVRLQEIDGPTDGVYCAVTPQAFNDIRALGVARQGDSHMGNMQPMFGGVAAAGGLGAPYTTGMNALTDTLVYMGATIIKTNHIPKSDIKLDGSAWTHNATGTASVVDTNIHNVIVDASEDDALGATEFADGQTELARTADLGDAKYDVNVMNFGTGGSGSVIAQFNPVRALMWQKDAIASLSLQGMKVDSIRDVRRNTNFTVASVMRGAGVLRPELCATVLGQGIIH